MRAVIQRCTKASVTINGELFSSIGKGLCVLIGISKHDTKQDMDFMVRKLLNVRLWDDTDGKRWQCSVKEKEYEILLLSQFTLFCKLKGNKPDFRGAMSPELASQYFADLVAAVRNSYTEDRVKTGSFGTFCQISIENDGPVTINLESPTKNEESEHLQKHEEKDTNET